MRQVLKKQINLNTMEAEIVAPEFGFELLTVHEDDDIPTIWYEVSEEVAVTKTFKFQCVRTGEYTPARGRYVGTAHCNSHNYHVYMVK